MALRDSIVRLSQGHLNVLTDCPRKFQHQYLDKLIHPLPIEQQEHLEWGSQFHLLMQQQELGLPVEDLLPADSVFLQCLRALKTANPLLFSKTGDREFRESEHQRIIEFAGYAIATIYDLAILQPDRAQIIDWKTYAKPQNNKYLIQNWQTRLYPFVLYETSDYNAEQISMTYWFVKRKKSLNIAPESSVISYNKAYHISIKNELSQLLHRLTQWLQRYEQGAQFPQVPVGSSQCDRCPFAIRCDRETTNRAATDRKATYFPSSTETIPSLDDIPEQPI
ncbi:PD-(D/E)XK nuclease family protein [Roseofilum casamattae]|uniref:PD-(D/E)XK nuclease family protein n=1 Tax=Roseofilum casamattae BLCC-M143 TaxID=3022442 RepID=A0ABT7C4D1_9CYAN|nr:PD-(D/E)XK nuclease family protein [Roseofilum casamattae]MDJ1185779.1 PD-(D/E)XK nuclease family protein [Roseofilum casamattae BLCC-M143]